MRPYTLPTGDLCRTASRGSGTVAVDRSIAHRPAAASAKLIAFPILAPFVAIVCQYRGINR